MNDYAERKMQWICDTQQPTLTEALARSLREIMSANGRPYRDDPTSPGYRLDPGLFNEHMAQWERAQDVLAWFEREHLQPPK